MGAIDSLWPEFYLRSDGNNGPGEWTVTDTVRISSGCGSNEMRLDGLWQKSHANLYLKKKKRIVFDKQLLKTANGYVNDKQQLRVQVEWDETLLLFQATYHKYDDVGRIHNYQMRLVPFFFSFVISFCFESGLGEKKRNIPYTTYLPPVPFK